MISSSSFRPPDVASITSVPSISLEKATTEPEQCFRIPLLHTEAGSDKDNELDTSISQFLKSLPENTFIVVGDLLGYLTRMQ